MPAFSLVVCLHGEGDLLQRLLNATADCRDDLVVVHDGPDTAGIRQIVEAANGRFFERPRAYQQEPHWAFAWGQAKHNWILRLDADEFPSREMKSWLQQFRAGTEPPLETSGYTCIWPLWNGRQVVSKKWPAGRIFIFDRRRVSFFGVVEQVPIPDVKFQPLDLVLEHQPVRKSYGLANLLLRKQAYCWRQVIARSMLGKPTDLECWRWHNEVWPEQWAKLREKPRRTALTGLVMGTLRAMRGQWRAERRIYPFAAASGPVHHAMIVWEYLRQRRAARRT